MSDELVWRRRRKGEENWRARTHAETGTYAVYIMDDYGTHTIRGVLIPDDPPGVISDSIEIDSIEIYSSTIGTLDEAKEACQQHHAAACRTRRWMQYMRDNEPPNDPPF